MRLLAPRRLAAALAVRVLFAAGMAARMGRLEAAFARCVFAAAVLVAIPFADAQHLLVHPHLFQVLEHFAGHAVGQVDQTVIAADAEAADELAFQSRFIGDGADDVARFHAMLVADFDAIGALAGFGRVRADLARRELALFVSLVAVAWFTCRTAFLAVAFGRCARRVFALRGRFEQQRAIALG